MIILTAAALAAAAPAAPASPPADAHARHMLAAEAGKHERMDSCGCCKDMAKHEDGHADRRDGR